MIRRLAVVLGSALVAVPLLSGTASASCLDDLTATNVTSGYTPPTYSSHWYGMHYVHVNGATVLVEGNALVSDGTTHVGDWAHWTDVVSTNTTNASLAFVDCVAG